MGKRVRTAVFLSILLTGAHTLRAQALERIRVPTIQVRNAERGSPEDTIFAGARDVLERVVNDPRFKAGILAGGFNGSKFRHPDGTVVDKTPQQVWDIIRCGVERGHAPDREIDLQVLLVPKTRPTVGSTVLGQFPIRTGYWFVNAAISNKDAVSLARHMMHEWMHVAGFFHYPSNSARGDVPYRVGELVREIGRKLRIEALAAAERSPRVGNNLVEARRWRDEATLLTENELLGSLLDEANDELELRADEWRTTGAAADRAFAGAACGT